MTRDQVTAGCELIFNDDGEVPDEDTCPACDCTMVDGCCDNCADQDDEDKNDDDWCPRCHGTGEGAFGHRCYHNRMRTDREIEHNSYLHRLEDAA